MRLTTLNGDMPGSQHPRAQLDGLILHREGADHYVSWSTYFPTSFPAISGPGHRGATPPWFVFFEWRDFPWNGSPLPGVFDVKTDRHGMSSIGLSRSQLYAYDRPWNAPLVTGQWHDFIVHVKFSKSPRVGFVELWLNGIRQRFVGGGLRLWQSTIMQDQYRGLYPVATNYRARGAVPGPITVYHDEVRVGTTLASVLSQ